MKFISMLVIGLILSFSALAQNVFVSIDPGLSQIDLDHDGQDEIIIKAWRENSNAHSFYVISFYKKGTDDQLSVIPMENQYRTTEPYINFVTTEGGAECTTSDYRILSKEKDTMLIQARRGLKKGYADEENVYFDLYALKKNTESLPGMPSFYFGYLETKQANKKYCDVNEALDTEAAELF